MEPPAPRVEWKVLALQLFVLPAGIVGICVGIFLLFGSLADDAKDSRALLSEMRGSGSSWPWDSNARWHAAWLLPDAIAKDRERLRADPAFARSLTELLEAADSPDEIRASMAHALGVLGDPGAVPALLRGLSAAGEERARTRFACAQSLGTLQAREAVGPLSALLEDPVPTVREMAVSALGAIGGPEAERTLLAALENSDPGVRWHAALRLGLDGNRAALPVLSSLLDRKNLEGIPAEKRTGVLASAARAAGALRDPGLKPALEALRGDPEAPVRMAAEEALQAYGR